MRKKMLPFLMMLVVSISFAQQNFDFSRNQATVWELSKRITIAVAKAMPEDKYNYKPVENIKSFGDQMTHITNSMLSMNSRFILNEGYLGSEMNAAKMSKSKIIAALESAFDVVIKTLKSQSDSSLKSQGKRHGAFPISKWQSFLFMRDHITNHRAKAVLYLRLNKISPPAYGFN